MAISFPFAGAINVRLVTDELEAQLREKDRALQTLQIQQSVPGHHASGADKQASSSAPDFDVSKFVAANPDLVSQPILETDVYGQYAGPPGSSGAATDFSAYSGPTLDSVNPVTELLSDPTGPHAISSSPITSTNGMSPGSMDSYMELRSWPPNLPTPDITRHLYVNPTD